MDIENIKIESLNCKSFYELSMKTFGYNNGKTYKKLIGILGNNFYDKEIIIKNCKFCGKQIENHKTFCNSSCAASFNNKERGSHSEETKIKISNSLLGREIKIYDVKYCKFCGKELTRTQLKRKSEYCSKKCAKSDPNYKEQAKNKMYERIKNGLHKGWTSRNIISYPEKFFIKVLENNNIKYNHNYVVNKRSLGLTDSSNYFLDFFIKDRMIDLEIDGGQHKLEDRIISDIERDKLLISNGYIVYRIKWKNINTIKGKEYIKQEIDKFLEFYKNAPIIGPGYEPVEP